VTHAFFEPDGDGFVATPLTRGPWDKNAQHGGPPAALLARAIEQQLPPELRLTRLSLDLLRPVPIGPVQPRATVRLGSRVARAQVVLEADGVEVITGVAHRTGDLDIAPETPGAPLPPPEDGTPGGFFPLPWDEGYHTAMSWTFVKGGWDQLGAAQVWLRQEVPLVAGEDPSPAQRTLVVADAGNGVSAAVDFGRFSFVNADLTVYLHRQPSSEWIGMDARTTVHPTGVGLATTTLHDLDGPVGTGNQSLVVTTH
jgi:hypothetical protein